MALTQKQLRRCLNNLRADVPLSSLARAFRVTPDDLRAALMATFGVSKMAKIPASVLCR